MAPITWLLIGVALLACEWLGAAFDGLLPAALAALLLSILTALLPLHLLVQLLLFALFTTAWLLAIRRWSVGQRERGIAISPAAERAVVISGFEGNDAGRVRWQGQSWAALNLEPARTLPIGAQVVVMGREGNHLQVLGSTVER